jgi:uncharacterized phage-associated protein
VYSAHQIANYFIRKSHTTGVELTPMKLHKLCYIAHGFHLAAAGSELLDEAIYAWQQGPVIKSFYHDFRQYKSGQITKLYRTNKGDYPFPGKEIHHFLEAVWIVFSGYDAIRLSILTHQDNTPWDIVWRQERGQYKHDPVIRNELILAHYKKLLEGGGPEDIGAL